MVSFILPCLRECPQVPSSRYIFGKVMDQRLETRLFTDKGAFMLQPQLSCTPFLMKNINIPKYLSSTHDSSLLLRRYLGILN